ncbi:cyclase family protein [Nucisporomicrobium flavum]|uniref:cyclase family protein n=1 Tax=Nucisporomicrobium flavum TaxID=2785915 RepID=UPI0018F53DA9|nr:cyclase family protein [Nucisporomicrobium flavum]
MSGLIDISRSINAAAAVYPGDDPIELAAVCEIGPEAPCNITSLGGWTTHFLTHIDAPKHFIPNGITLDQLPLDRFIMPAIVVEVGGDAVTAEDVPTQIAGKAVLFKTRNSATEPTTFDERHVYIGKDAVQVIIERGAKTVGIDYLSVDRYGDEEYPAHRGLLSNEILILEGLDLSAVTPGSEFELNAVPLRIADADGSPVRALLRR